VKKTTYTTSLNEAAGVNDARKGYVDAFADNLIGWGGITAESTHLDVPCGTGNMVERMREKGKIGMAYLSDINPAMLDAAQQAVPDRARYVLADAADIGTVMPEQVDSITSLNGFHIYIDEKDAFLGGCHDILKPGGRLIFDVSTMGLDNDSRRLLERHDALMRDGAARLGSEAHLPVHADQPLLDSYADMAQSHGLTLVGKHVTEKFIDYAKFEESTVKIPGRLRPRFPQLDDEQRMELFLNASRQAQAETGVTSVLHSRAFFVLEKALRRSRACTPAEAQVRPPRGGGSAGPLIAAA